ncbi:MAG TPA: 5-oxoprolinase subunit PxpB [Vicinamibacteria bacterium]|jgi:KipI family sensor histidine kinase inhibitor
MSAPRILPAGEAAVAVEFGDGINPKLNALVRALDRKLLDHPFDGFQEAVPTYRSLLVLFDPFRAPSVDVARHLLELAHDLSDEEPAGAPLKEVPTVYDGEDLDTVAEDVGLSRAEVVAIHSGSEYRVYMLGFSPGFAYMGLLPEAIETRRMATPRTRVPAGSVAIAGRQTAVYPSATPGGWNLIGRSSLRWFDARSSPPTFFLPGDRVRFVSVSELEEVPALGSTNQAPRGDPTFEVLDGGLLTTVQDLGRIGYQRYGVPVAGAADAASLRAANLLVGNEPGAAALECTVAGPSLTLLRTVVLSVCGADLGPVLERGDLGRWEIPAGSSFLARAGNVLSFSGRRAGCRAYVAVAGGLGVPEVLGSRATYVASILGGYKGRALERGDVLTALSSERAASPGRRWPHASISTEGAATTVRLVLGLQEDAFTKKAKTTLTSSEYVVAPSSDRMGCRLKGPRLEHKGPSEITTDGMVLGAVQVPPDGQPIVMLADRATTGGYPKIGTIIRADVPRLAQLMPADPLRFEVVDLEEARKALFAARRGEEKSRKVL